MKIELKQSNYVQKVALWSIVDAIALQLWLKPYSLQGTGEPCAGIARQNSIKAISLLTCYLLLIFNA